MSTKTPQDKAYNPSVFKGLPKSTKGRGLHWPPVPADIEKDAYCRSVWWVTQIGQSMLETLKTLDLGHGAGPAPPAYRRARALLAADRALFEFCLNAVHTVLGPRTSSYVVLGLMRVMRLRVENGPKSSDLAK